MVVNAILSLNHLSRKIHAAARAVLGLCSNQELVPNVALSLFVGFLIRRIDLPARLGFHSLRTYRSAGRLYSYSTLLLYSLC